MVQVTGKVKESTKELIAQLREENLMRSDGAVIDFLAEQYVRKAANAPRQDERHFVARIDPRDQQLIGEFVDQMYDQHGYKEPQILRYFAKLQKALTEKKVHLLKLPKAVNERLLAIAEPKVDNGDVQSLNHFLTNLLKSALPKAGTEDKQKSSWF